MLKVNRLNVAIEKKEILRGVNLDLKPGEVAVIFGPNGCGKTTLLNTLMGLSKYQIKGGQIEFKDKKINSWPIEKRARAGIGLLWQKPPKVAGLKLAEIMNVINGKTENPEAAGKMKMDRFLNRGVNDDLSGGELKRSELLQLLSQNPDLLLLDEPDSGVDVDNIKLMAEIIEDWRKKGKSILLVTHGSSLLKYLSVKKAYVMIDGQIRCQGKPMEILKAISDCGYQGCVDCQRRQNNG